MSSATAQRPQAGIPVGGRVLFSVPFRSAMTNADVERLNRGLDMATHLQPKLRQGPAGPAVKRLDFSSGLFLSRGAEDDAWALEGRTWGTPAASAVRRWHVLAADAARELDPSVPAPQLPERAPERRVGGSDSARPRSRWARLRGGGWQI